MMRSLFPFFWQPAGVVPSLADLPLADCVTAKADVTKSIDGNASGQHPLIVAELAGGKIIGDLRLAATADDVVIGGIQTVAGCDNFHDLQNHYALHRRRFRIPRYWRGTALLLGAAASGNYYHWLLDSVPRWKMLQAAGWANYDFVLLHSRPSRFQEETLDRLGVPAARRLRPSKNFVHQFERLVVPVMPFPTWQVARWACDWVRSLFPERRSGPERIYLTRRSAPGRRLINEPELEAALERLGFACVQPEKLPVAEQANLFSAAQCVVSPHGAGLTNLVFAPPGTLLVELFHPDKCTPVYQNLAAACGLRYASFVGRRTRELARHDDRRAEFEVNVAEVLKILAAHA